MASELVGYFITWATYGSWLPGDSRGWRRRFANRSVDPHRVQPCVLSDGTMAPEPLLEDWCGSNMTGTEVFLRPNDRKTVEDAILEHCCVRQWGLLAVNARTNHVHMVVQAFEKPKVVRDQLKANCTRRLRRQQDPLNSPHTWAKGGDIEFLFDDESLQESVRYVLEAQ